MKVIWFMSLVMRSIFLVNVCQCVPLCAIALSHCIYAPAFMPLHLCPCIVSPEFPFLSMHSAPCCDSGDLSPSSIQRVQFIKARSVKPASTILQNSSIVLVTDFSPFLAQSLLVLDYSRDSFGQQLNKPSKLSSCQNVIKRASPRYILTG